MGVGSGRQEGRGPLDFHTWYILIVLNSAIFSLFLLFFGLFSVAPPLEIFLSTPLDRKQVGGRSLPWNKSG